MFGFFFFLAIGWWLAPRRRARKAPSAALAARGIVALAASVLALSVRGPTRSRRRPPLRRGVLVGRNTGTIASRAVVASAFLLVLFAQRLYIYDRMNTFFKLYLEAGFSFAVATAALVFGAGRRGDRAWVPAGGSGDPVPAAAFTGATAARAAVSRHFARYSGPSLDGLRYLKKQRRRNRAVLWSASMSGTPVVLEAQGRRTRTSAGSRC